MVLTGTPFPMSFVVAMRETFLSFRAPRTRGVACRRRKLVKEGAKTLRRTLAVLVALTATPLFAWTGCGLTFDLPQRWTAAVIDRDAKQCEIGLRPAGWERMRARSRWPENEYAIRLKRYFRATLDTATEDLEFERSEERRVGKGC